MLSSGSRDADPATAAERRQRERRADGLPRFHGACPGSAAGAEPEAVAACSRDRRALAGFRDGFRVAGGRVPSCCCYSAPLPEVWSWCCGCSGSAGTIRGSTVPPAGRGVTAGTCCSVALRHLPEVFIVTPQGSLLAPNAVELRMNPDDIESLAELIDLNLVNASAAEAYAAEVAAHSARVVSNVPLEVGVVPDEAVPPGRYRLRQRSSLGCHDPVRGPGHQRGPGRRCAWHQVGSSPAWTRCARPTRSACWPWWRASP